MSLEKCLKTYPFMTRYMFCGAGKSNVCAGDSGGPAGKHNKFVGINSFSSYLLCTDSNVGGFTVVFYYRQWIKEKSGLAV